MWQTAGLRLDEILSVRLEANVEGEPLPPPWYSYYDPAIGAAALPPALTA